MYFVAWRASVTLSFWKKKIEYDNDKLFCLKKIFNIALLRSNENHKIDY